MKNRKLMIVSGLVFGALIFATDLSAATSDYSEAMKDPIFSNYATTFARKYGGKLAPEQQAELESIAKHYIGAIERAKNDGQPLRVSEKRELLDNISNVEGVARYTKARTELTGEEMAKLAQRVSKISTDRRLSHDHIKIDFSNFDLVMENSDILQHITNLNMSGLHTGELVKKHLNDQVYDYKNSHRNDKAGKREFSKFVDREAREINAEKIAQVLNLCDPNKLEETDLSGNDLTEIPSAILQCKNLRWLKLGHNKIKEIPEELADLKELRILALDHNNIRSVPAGIVELPNLLQLYLENNDFSPSEASKLDMKFREIIKKANEKEARLSRTKSRYAQGKGEVKRVFKVRPVNIRGTDFGKSKKYVEKQNQQPINNLRIRNKLISSAKVS